MSVLSWFSLRLLYVYVEWVVIYRTRILVLVGLPTLSESRVHYRGDLNHAHMYVHVHGYVHVHTYVHVHHARSTHALYSELAVPVLIVHWSVRILMTWLIKPACSVNRIQDAMCLHSTTKHLQNNGQRFNDRWIIPPKYRYPAAHVAVRVFFSGVVFSNLLLGGGEVRGMSRMWLAYSSKYDFSDNIQI